MNLIRLQALLKHQQSILSQIALDESTQDIFDNICLAIEDIIEDKTVKCSILCLRGEKLYGCSAPNLDPEYNKLTDGLHIGANVGSCGTAAYSKTRIIVENIETSPLWASFKEIALSYNLRSCWSTPIISSDSIVLGTFAIYHEHPCAPTESDIELIDYFVDFSRIALQKQHDTLKLNTLIKDLEHSTKKFNALTKVIPDTAFILSEYGEYVDVYSANESLLLQPISQLKGKKISDFLSEDVTSSIMKVINKTLDTNTAQVFDYVLDVQKGQVFFEGKTTPIIYEHINEKPQRYVLWMARDISVRKAAELEIEKLAYYDHLTGLPNRRLLNEKLSACVERINRSHKIGALLFLDIDDFKNINDSYGHNAGDAVLVEVANRLNSVVRSSDTIARMGGDEFVVLLEYIGDDNSRASHEVELVAEKIQQVFNATFNVKEANLHVNGSIGICLIDNTNAGVDSILNLADSAMYSAKKKGGDSFHFYRR